MSTLEVALHVRVHGALAATGAGRGQSDVARPLARSAWGTLVLSASQVKGRLRHACEQVARALAIPVCHPPSPNTMCPRAPEVPAAPCAVCRLFGAPGIPSSLRWANLLPLDDPAAWPDAPPPAAAATSDSHPSSPPGPVEPAALALPTAFRGGIPLDRRRLVGQDSALYWVETSPPLPSLGLVFGNDRAIVGLLGERATSTAAAGALRDPAAEASGWDDDRLVQLLLAACRLATAFGAGETRGLGWSEVRAGARVNGRAVPLDLESLRRGTP